LVAEETSGDRPTPITERLSVDVTTLEWTITFAVTVGVLLFDVIVIARDPREPSMKECAVALCFYVGAALAFGLFVWLHHGHDYGIEFYTGWLTEYSLSIDNLFVFIILMAALKVPRKYQQEALLVGIVLALVFRGIFIALGYALIENFSWVFYLFGAFLVYTAVGLVRSYRSHDDEHPEDNAVVTFARRHLNVGEKYHGLKLWYHENGVRVVSPIVIVIIALGVTDILFALDSIPAIFGITQEPYLVFTANVFALMGLRQLYFLLGGLLQRLVYLSLGLAFILAFIGVKLVLHALHENELPFINDGEHFKAVPEISSLLSLGVIIATLVVTAVASLVKSAKDPSAREPVLADSDDTTGSDWRD
jgi:tellurite resistance protein TerC